MLKSGIYCAKTSDLLIGPYDIEMEVDETEESYIFTLDKLDSPDGADEIFELFYPVEQVTILKNDDDHPIKVWNDHSFTFYPYRETGYYFTRMEG